MVSGLFAAASAMRALINTQDTVANNLANVNTPGFKSGHASYTGFYVDGISDRSMSGKTSSGGGVALATIGKDMGVGALQTTGHSLDAAIDGPGFFAVRGPDDQRLYTRNGRFGLNNESQLVTQAGWPVLNDGGRPLVVEGANPKIKPDGTVYADGVVIDRLMMTEFEKPELLESIGMSLYSASEAAGVPMDAVESQIAPKSLEMSNVNVVRETIKMVMGMRQYEASQRAVRIIDDSLKGSRQNTVANLGLCVL